MKKFLVLILNSLFLMIYTPVYADNPGPAGPKQLQELFMRIINLAAEAAFVVLLIMLVYAGIKFLTSGGDPKAIGAAGGTITWALLGILFMAIGWLLLLLIKNFTGVDVTQFCIGFNGCQ
ncbi:MAG: hypothetical protein PHQ59_00755 [Candidatus Daviesbacteria bacterium]|nr:hypothetical protein [Candidatus Daviesbacteria bacterium]